MGASRVTKTVVHRFLLDRVRRVYFGYDISVRRLPDDAGFEVKFSRLSIARDDLPGDDTADYAEQALPAYPTPQIVRTGYGLALDLMVNPITGQKLVDYLTVGDAEERTRSAVGDARDFRLSDAALNLRKPRVSLNGKLVADASESSMSGASVWIYIDGLGPLRDEPVARSRPGFRESRRDQRKHATVLVGRQ